MKKNHKQLKNLHIMRKLYFIAALALASVTANAQKSLSLSTYTGTDIAQYDNQVMNVSVSRYIFNGWNTISLPFDMSAEKVEEVFGTDCRLERLVGVENDGTDIKMNFMDCKKEGIKANVPYILNYQGETTTKTFRVDNALIVNGTPAVSFTVANTGEKVTFSGAKSKLDSKGLYGILAKDNSEASFVNVDNISTGFYATRCFIQVSSGNSAMLNSKHIEGDETTAITSVVKKGEKVDVYNLSGVKVAANASINDVNNLSSGVYVVKGKKVMVK